MREYTTPDFDVTVFEIEDIIATISAIGPKDPNPETGDPWFG